MNYLAFLLFLLPTVNCALRPRPTPEQYCPVAKKLSTCGLPRNQLQEWTCIAWFESVGKTNAKATYSGVTYYGLFQISSRVWCSESGTPGKGCAAKCTDFLNENLNDDCKCALTVYNDPPRNPRKFTHWQAWREQCNGQVMPDLKKCRL